MDSSYDYPLQRKNQRQTDCMVAEVCLSRSTDTLNTNRMKEEDFETKTSSQKNTPKPKLKCSFCRKTGHKISSCRFRKKKEKEEKQKQKKQLQEEFISKLVAEFQRKLEDLEARVLQPMLIQFMKLLKSSEEPKPPDPPEIEPEISQDSIKMPFNKTKKKKENPPEVKPLKHQKINAPQTPDISKSGDSKPKQNKDEQSGTKSLNQSLQDVDQKSPTDCSSSSKDDKKKKLVSTAQNRFVHQAKASKEKAFIIDRKNGRLAFIKYSNEVPIINEETTMFLTSQELFEDQFKKTSEQIQVHIPVLLLEKLKTLFKPLPEDSNKKPKSKKKN